MLSWKQLSGKGYGNIAKCFYYTGLINTKKEKLRIIHPFFLLFVAFRYVGFVIGFFLDVLINLYQDIMALIKEDITLW